MRINQAVRKLYGNSSARSKKIAGLALVCAAALWLAYHAGAKRATLNEKVGQLDNARAVAADTTAARSAKVDTARARSDSVGGRAAAAVTTARDYHVSPVPVLRITNTSLQIPPANKPYFDSLLFAIKTRDVKIAKLNSAITGLEAQVRTLKLERPAHDALVLSLNQRIALDTKEIGLLKSAKTPRLGFKSGLAAGIIVTVVTIGALQK